MTFRNSWSEKENIKHLDYNIFFPTTYEIRDYIIGIKISCSSENFNLQLRFRISNFTIKSYDLIVYRWNKNIVDSP